MKKVFSVMMVAFAMIAIMVSCDRDKGTYIVSYGITNKGTLVDADVTILNGVLSKAFSNVVYEDKKLDDAKSDLTTRINEFASEIAQAFDNRVFEVTIYLKDNAGETKAKWVISCKYGDANIQ